MLDVNVLVYASREELPHHGRANAILASLLNGDEIVAIANEVLAGFIRLVSHPRSFKTSTPLDQAIAFAQAIRASPNALVVAPGERHWAIFTSLFKVVKLPGSQAWDAYLAAIAIEADCEWLSFDQGFKRFSSLRWVNLLDPSVRI